MVEPLHNIENVIKPSDDEQQGLHFSPHKSLREDFPHKSNYTVLFEYAMLAGVNNRLHVLMQLQGCKEANFFSPMHPLQDQSHLIQPSQLVPVPSILAESGCTVFQRLMRGEDQLAACGQLGNPGPVPAPQQLQMALNSTSSVLLRSIDKQHSRMLQRLRATMMKVLFHGRLAITRKLGMRGDLLNYETAHEAKTYASLSLLP
ncbi:hypothetical protein SAY87_018082 [Trapa incisa]|uniref:Uncharacterized protein n=1 Tax=Trapa incisa TaxID=236973 RepID=A0AAN7LA48_9MYRT|nr:hypothetical protein SAY87_018082 [Trapa incisa]